MAGIIIAPVRTEKIIKLSLKERKLAFFVNINANAQEIKKEIERIFKVKVEKINTHVRKGKKIAYVKFAPEVNIEELATQLNIA
ncbi:MAG: 50S ribosomal protein L23 [Candidatus Anstonellales archaeon]